MSAAAPLPRTASTRRQQQAAYNGTPERERPHRSQSQAMRNTPTASPRRSQSTSQAQSASSHNRGHSTNLDRVARQDVEQTNLAQSHSTRRSESQDRPVNGTQPHTPRMDPTRGTAGHSRTQSRYSDQPVPAPAYDGHTPSSESRVSASTHNRRRTTLDTQTGHWDLGKTIGAGSMGKVKLAKNKVTGEHVAVKIVPRQSTESEHRTPQERERADHSKEIRTAREAAIVTLVDHPYICGMRDVVRTNYHWYMLFEYVNGGQMLDYIISHGRLKEKQARKFGRQIASALDYCHRNSIVHRDLKIENILISKSGDIKIIDFGLSNLFSPRNHLKTFCGSLYFAAPELLQAKLYTGPEVDVWSFGIVLYVLVCGKVPFDDQSMPQLHAKIKKGVVEYPPWLTPECRGLIARMLTTNPSERATLQEIMTHPWMTKGFNGPPENHLPTRKPIQLPLDPVIIEKMTGFDFGEPEMITNQLTKIIESDEYQRAVRLSERQSYHQPQPDVEQRRGVFTFYKRRSSVYSKDTLSSPSAEALSLGLDPLNAFHPLISVYYLAQEKMEREAREQNPGALAMPSASGEKLIPVPDLPAPEAAHTNTQSYEMAGEKPTGGRSRPRARTHGEDDVTDGLKVMNINAAPSPVQPTIIEPPADQRPTGHTRKESTAAGIFRRLSTRRSKEPGDRERPNHPPPALAAYNANEGPRKSISMRRPQERDSSATRERDQSSGRPDTGASTKQTEMLSPPKEGPAIEKTKRSHGLGRSISVNSSDMRRRFARRGVSEGSSMRPPMSSSGSAGRETSFEQQDSVKEPASDVETSRPVSAVASRTRSMGHAHRESMQVRRLRRGQHRTSDVPEETDQDMLDETEGQHHDSSSPTGMKPVYLKGLFSVSTTSSRPLGFIRSDIIRVLRQLGVEYKDIKGGFSCRHAPSIMPQPPADETAPSGAQTLHSPVDVSHRRKISLGGFRERINGDRDESRSHAPTTPRQKASFANSEEESDDDPPTSNPRYSVQRPAGETSTHVQADLGNNMALRFEIFVVKVPLLSLHGIQFKKVDGGTWQYKNMAQKILHELRL